MCATTLYPELENQYQIPTYSKWPITLIEGEGFRVRDSAGVEYLDFYGGHCVALLGHCHPGWVQAVTRQAGKLSFYSNVVSNDIRAVYQQRLVDFSPSHLTRVFLCNSGAEANETAIKVALKATGRNGLVTMKGGFHGRTAGALSVTTIGHYRDQFPSLVREVEVAEFGDLDSLRNHLRPDTAAVILEPIQSMNGICTAYAGYLADVVELCEQNGTLAIFDEVQTGVGRVGASFAAQRFAATPHLVTTAKGLANGIPIGAVLASEEVAMEIKLGELGTTFGGGPIACAAGLAVLDAIEKEKLIDNALRLESVANQMLITGPVHSIRGYGLLLGLETSVPAREVTKHLFENQILAGTSAHSHVVRLMPPLTIDEESFERLATVLESFSG